MQGIAFGARRVGKDVEEKAGNAPEASADKGDEEGDEGDEQAALALGKREGCAEHGTVGLVGLESGVDAARVGSGCVHGRPKNKTKKTMLDEEHGFTSFLGA